MASSNTTSSTTAPSSVNGTDEHSSIEAATLVPRQTNVVEAGITESGSDIVTTTSPIPKNTKCHFLDITPPEMRNRIYELVLSPSELQESVDLKDCAPPSKAILLTCSHVYAETKEMYRVAYRAFWSETRFEINLRAQLTDTNNAMTEYLSFIATLRDEDLAHISKMLIHEQDHWTVWMYRNGLWNRNNNCSSNWKYLLVPQARGYLLKGDGFDFVGSIARRSDVWWVVALEDSRTDSSDRVVEHAKALANKNGLTRAELGVMVSESEYV